MSVVLIVLCVLLSLAVIAMYLRKPDVTVSYPQPTLPSAAPCLSKARSIQFNATE